MAPRPPFGTGSSLKRHARRLRRTVHGRLDWREDELWGLLVNVTTWDHARVIIALFDRGDI